VLISFFEGMRAGATGPTEDASRDGIEQYIQLGCESQGSFVSLLNLFFSQPLLF
jgi:hypothetical protein